jgi:hypothetical protein
MYCNRDFLDTFIASVGRDGEEKKDFTVYASFATKYSRFFRAALCGE